MALIPIPEILSKISLSPNLITVYTSLNMLAYFPIIKSLYRMYNIMLPSSAQFQSFLWLWGNFVRFGRFSSTVCKNYTWPELELELELELILTTILELELELNPKTVAGIGIGINSIFFGMTKGLHNNMKPLSKQIPSKLNLIPSK